MGEIVFITGTDTGAGKTLLTALLLAHLREIGVRALAMKPFCSGGRDDAKLLFELNDREVPIESVNPFYFRKPLAPVVAAKLMGRPISFRQTLTKIREVEKKCAVLLIEGVGGLMVPLGERFMVIDLIARLRCSVVLAARNGIGVINHVLLSTSVLSKLGRRRVAVVLMGKSHPDISAHNNSEVLRELLPGIDVLEVPFIRGNLRSADAIRAQAKRGCKELLIRLAQTRALPQVVRRIEE